MTGQNNAPAIEDNFALPAWDAETRAGIEKADGGKKDMLETQQFGTYTCRLTKIKRTRVGSANPGLIIESVVLESTNEAHPVGSSLSNFIFCQSKTEYQKRKNEALLASLGSSLFAAQASAPDFNPFKEIDDISKLGRLTDEMSARLKFRWIRAQGRPKQGFDQKTGKAHEGYYDEDSVVPA